MIEREVAMKMIMFRKLTMVFFLVFVCSMTVWGASDNKTDYSYQPYYGTPGHRGEDAVGKVLIDDVGTPQAFYRNGENTQMINTWLGMDVYYQGTFHGSYWYYFKPGLLVPFRWVEVDGRWYYQTREGAVGGWYEIAKGEYYYFDPVERYMWTSGNVERDGQMYTIGNDGIPRKASTLGYSEGIVAGGGNSGWAEDGGR